MFGFRGGNLETGLTTTAAAVVSVDIALWLTKGQPGTVPWFLYGVVVCGLGLSLAGTLALRLRGHSAKAENSSLTQLRAALSKARQRGQGSVPRDLCTASLFYEGLGEEIQPSMAYGLTIGVIVLRIGPGEAPGAELQGAVKDRIRSAARRGLRSSDVAGQLGPDEFALFLPETDRRGALLAGARVIGLLEELATGTVGVAVFPEDGASPQELVDAARGRAVPYHRSEAA